MSGTKFQPVIRRRRRSILADERDGTDVQGLETITENDEILLQGGVEEFVESTLDKLDAADVEEREQAVHSLIGLKLEDGKIL